MGYNMEITDQHFFIPADLTDAALVAVKSLHGREKELGATGGSWGPSGEKIWYAWMNGWEAKETSFDAVMDAWRWHVGMSEGGNVVEINFDGERMGNDEILLSAIAPFVSAGSYIEMLGEDGAHWRWVFDGKSLHTKNGRVVYD